MRQLLLLQILFLLGFLLSASHGINEHQSIRSSTQIIVQQPRIHQKANQEPTTSLLLLTKKIRGGDLGPIPGKRLAQSLAIFAFLDAIAASLAPVTSLQWMGIEISNNSKKNKNNDITTTTNKQQQQQVTYHYIHGVGASAATVAATLFLATTKGTTLEVALFCGLLIRLISMTFVFGQTKDLGMNKDLFGITWTLIAGTMFALVGSPDNNNNNNTNNNKQLLFGVVVDAMALTKVLSLSLGVHGCFLYFDPNTFVHKVSGKKGNEKEDPMTLNMASINGGYMAVSGLVCYLLANGMDPIHVAGYASLSYMPVLLKLIAAIPIDKKLFMGRVDAKALAFVVTTVLASIAVGTLHDQ